jgi:hypothetical protein
MLLNLPRCGKCSDGGFVHHPHKTSPCHEAAEALPSFKQSNWSACCSTLPFVEKIASFKEFNMAYPKLINENPRNVGSSDKAMIFVGTGITVPGLWRRTKLQDQSQPDHGVIEDLLKTYGCGSGDCLQLSDHGVGLAGKPDEVASIKTVIPQELCCHLREPTAPSW